MAMVSVSPFRGLDMDKPKKEPIVLHHNSDAKLCLNCGFPNRSTDSQCMYCKTGFVEDEGLLSWVRNTFYILKWRWQLKKRKDTLKTASVFSSLGYFVLGVLLSGAGLYLFTSAVTENSFSSGIIAVFFLFYGMFTLKALYSKKNR